MGTNPSHVLRETAFALLVALTVAMAIVTLLIFSGWLVSEEPPAAPTTGSSAPADPAATA